MCEHISKVLEWGFTDTHDFKAVKYGCTNCEETSPVPFRVKDVFIDTVMRNRSAEIDKLRSSNPELFSTIKEMLTSVNDVINNKISGASKTIAKKQKQVVAEQVAEDDLSFLDDVDSVLDTSFLDDLDNII
jgi:Fe-S cluster assembly ATPase SufC